MKAGEDGSSEVRGVVCCGGRECEFKNGFCGRNHNQRRTR
jgi:hypothetical protein